ncbi:hypothetical protein J7L13_03325 [bacterium]|nr:hypothetical protein [bacterium]
MGEIEKKLALARGQKVDSLFWRRLAFREKWVRNLLQRISPELVVCWNGFYLEGRIFKKRTKTVFLERGFLPSTLQLDLKGVNYFSSLKEKLDSHSFSEERGIEKIIQKVREKAFTPPRVKLRELLGEWLFSPRGSRMAFLWRILKALLIYWRWQEQPLPPSFWLVILQQNFDTQMLLFSPFFSSKEEFAETIIQALPNDFLVLKVHPRDLGREDFFFLRKLTSQRVFLSLKRPLGELLRDCKGVILINSASAIEALAFRKPVFCLGKAFYGKVKGVKEITPAKLSRIKPFPVNSSQVKRFFSFLQTHLVPNDPSLIASRLQRFLNDKKR